MVSSGFIHPFPGAGHRHCVNQGTSRSDHDLRLFDAAVFTDTRRNAYPSAEGYHARRGIKGLHQLGVLAHLLSAAASAANNDGMTLAVVFPFLLRFFELSDRRRRVFHYNRRLFLEGRFRVLRRRRVRILRLGYRILRQNRPRR